MKLKPIYMIVNLSRLSGDYYGDQLVPTDAVWNTAFTSLRVARHTVATLKVANPSAVWSILKSYETSKVEDKS